jgi:hypothetical protein
MSPETLTVPVSFLSAARAYRDAELHCAAHETACAYCAGCGGRGCDTIGELWLTEMRARKAMWDELDALESGPQMGTEK